MAKLFEDRGVALDRTYQLNVGGNMDFKNMLERERLESKKVSKTQAVTSNLTGELADKIDDRNVHIGPSDYVAWLDDRKWAYVRLEGRAFGDVPLNLEYKLEVWDSPNSAGIIIDAIRAAKIAKDRGIGGPIISASSYLMKCPPVQLPDDEGRRRVEAFIARRGVTSQSASAEAETVETRERPPGPGPGGRFALSRALSAGAPRADSVPGAPRASDAWCSLGPPWRSAEVRALAVDLARASQGTTRGTAQEKRTRAVPVRRSSSFDARRSDERPTGGRVRPQDPRRVIARDGGVHGPCRERPSATPAESSTTRHGPHVADRGPVDCLARPGRSPDAQVGSLPGVRPHHASRASRAASVDHRTLVEAQLEQEPVGLADLAARADRRGSP